MKLKYTKTKLCKAFGVKENQIFKVDGPDYENNDYFKIKNNKLFWFDKENDKWKEEDDISIYMGCYIRKQKSFTKEEKKKFKKIFKK